ncbi:MAG: HDOD domain-containing protein, partial [Candidatus Latescibacteria bacterium]|nr:HDOD domain-containing protein [Candidatus Latescibacterota bacterium]
MVDDDENILKLFSAYFSSKKFKFHPVKDPRVFLKSLKIIKPDIIFMDLKIGGVSGVSLIKAFRKYGLTIPIVIVSAYIDENIKKQLAGYDVADYYSKPVDMKGLDKRINSILGLDFSDKPPGLLIISENKSIEENPDKLLTAEFIEKNQLNIIFKPGFKHSIEVLKKPENNIRLILIDGSREARIKAMAKLLQIIESKLGAPIYFFADRITSSLKKNLLQFGFTNFISRSEISPENIAKKLEAALAKAAGGIRKGVSRQRTNIIKQLKSIKALPPMPDIYVRIEKLSHNPNATSKDYSEVLELDPGITARLLRMSNSAFYSFNRKIKSVKDTVTLMGTREIISLVRLACVTRNLATKPEVEEAARRVWEHSATCAMTAKLLYNNENISEEDGIEDELFICGILHDIGKIAFWKFFPEIYMNFMLLPNVSSYPSIKEEDEFMGASHVEVGRTLAEFWNLPERLMEVIAFHHTPMLRSESELVKVTHIADIVCRIIMKDIPPEREPDLSEELLEEMGLPVGRVAELAEKYGQTIMD